MKKILLAGLIVLSLVLLSVFVVVPSFAQNGENRGDSEVWQEMHQACVNGDWDAMLKVMQNIDYDDMPCHQGYPGTQQPSPENGSSAFRWNGMGGHMGGGMMGGMMGW